MTYRTLAAAFLLPAALLLSTAPAATVKVDINPDNNRNDVLTPGIENWPLADAPTATRKFGDVTVTLRPAGKVGDGLHADWRKLGYDTGATLASDGVFIKAGDKGGAIEMALSGLTPGRHSVATYHCSLWKGSVSRYSVSVNGEQKLTRVTPSQNTLTDDDAASAYVEFDAEAGKDVVLTIKPDGTGEIDNVVLNGFEIDGVDPAKKALKPIPFRGDEHAPEHPTLTWAPPKPAAKHHVYFGTSKDSVAVATKDSPEFKAEVTKPEFATKDLNLNTNDTYYWRVDEIHDGSAAVKGDVWSFRVRHLAFPGAEGHGRFARGGRGGKVYEVTNLNDSGPGSLREAVEAAGPRTVVFRVGGTIALKDKLVIKNPYLTVAGQTAPGDGICIRGATFGNYYTHDSIIRYVRVRVGDEILKGIDGMGFAGTDHSIIDHCSISWTIDEAVSSRQGKNITFQRNLIAQALNMSRHPNYVGTGKGHSFAGSISGNIGSFHHNLLAHCAGRNWSLAGGLTPGGKMAGYLDIRNNVVYNWEHRTNDGGVKALNLVGNYYIPGPATRVFHLLKPDTGMPGDPQQYFVAANMMEGRPQYDADNWQNGGVIFDNRKLDLNASPQVKLDKPFCEPYITEQTAKEAYETVVADVGANYPKLDAYDAVILQDVLKRTATHKGSKTGTPGIIDSQTDVGGWPELKSGEAPTDSDHDGMPDDWEKQHNLNPNDPADGNADSAGDGYTNLERYLNSIVANRGAKK